MRAIDGDALKSIKFHPLPYTHIVPDDVNAESYQRGWNDAVDTIVENAPTIEPERKRGYWMPLQLSIAYPPYQCSCCFGNAPMVMVGTGRFKKGHLEALLTNFCPNCGSYNGGEQKEGAQDG